MKEIGERDRGVKETGEGGRAGEGEGGVVKEGGQVKETGEGGRG